MNKVKTLTVGVILYLAMASWCFADIYINVMAVNGTNDPKTSNIHFDLPGELTADDILDTSSLQLDYSVDDANYFVYGAVTLRPKESKTFRIHVKDKWMVTTDEVDGLKKQIDQGYETRANRTILPKRISLRTVWRKRSIISLIFRRPIRTVLTSAFDAYRAYAKEIKRLENDALNVSYWRSDPSVDESAQNYPSDDRG